MTTSQTFHASATKWSASMRFIGPRGKRKSMPETEVDDDVYAAMHEIARMRKVSIYDICRMAFRRLVDCFDFNGGGG